MRGGISQGLASLEGSCAKGKVRGAFHKTCKHYGYCVNYLKEYGEFFDL